MVTKDRNTKQHKKRVFVAPPLPYTPIPPLSYTLHQSHHYHTPFTNPTIIIHPSPIPPLSYTLHQSHHYHTPFTNPTIIIHPSPIPPLSYTLQHITAIITWLNHKKFYSKICRVHKLSALTLRDLNEHALISVLCKYSFISMKTP